MAEQSRDLIREYLTKTRNPPPPIFQLPFTSNNTTAALNDEVNMAYKHPILLMDSPDDECDFNNDDKNNEINLNNILTKDELKEQQESSFIIPIPKKNAFSSLISLKSDRDNNEDEKPMCRLIGKVNPNLIKTWEQLNGNLINNNQNSNKQISLTNSESSEKQSCVVFYRKPFTFKDDNNCLTNDDNFHVNKVLHSESSGDFYDSIDDRSIIENTYVVDNIIMNSMYHDTEVAGGEGMAECNSIDNKKICWSIENI